MHAISCSVWEMAGIKTWREEGTLMFFPLFSHVSLSLGLGRSKVRDTVHRGRQGKDGSWRYLGIELDASAHDPNPKTPDVLLSNYSGAHSVPPWSFYFQDPNFLVNSPHKPRTMYPPIHYLIHRLSLGTNYLMLLWAISCCAKSMHELVILIVALRTI